MSANASGDYFLSLQTKGYDPVFGARPVKRAVQRELETGLAKALLKGEFGEDDTGNQAPCSVISICRLGRSQYCSHATSGFALCHSP